MNEKQLTKGIITLLTSCGWYVIRTHRPGQFATHPGVSDLICVAPKGVQKKTVHFWAPCPVVAFIEVKGPRGKVSIEQQLFLEDMRNRGHIAFVAESIEQVITELQLPVIT